MRTIRRMLAVAFLASICCGSQNEYRRPIFAIGDIVQLVPEGRTTVVLRVERRPPEPFDCAGRVTYHYWIRIPEIAGSFSTPAGRIRVAEFELQRDSERGK